MATSEFGFQIPLIAELCDDIAVSIAAENFITFENIRVVKFFEDFDFGEQ